MANFVVVVREVNLPLSTINEAVLQVTMIYLTQQK